MLSPDVDRIQSCLISRFRRRRQCHRYSRGLSNTHGRRSSSRTRSSLLRNHRSRRAHQRLNELAPLRQAHYARAARSELGLERERQQRLDVRAIGSGRIALSRRRSLGLNLSLGSFNRRGPRHEGHDGARKLALLARRDGRLALGTVATSVAILAVARAVGHKAAAAALEAAALGETADHELGHVHTMPRTRARGPATPRSGGACTRAW